MHLAQHETDIEVDNIPNLPLNQSVYVALRSSQIIGKPLRLDAHDFAYDYLIGELQAVSYAGDYYLAEVKLIQHDQQGVINTLDTVLQVHLPLSYWGSDIQYVSSFIHQHLELSIQKGAMVILDDVVDTTVQTQVTAQVA